MFLVELDVKSIGFSFLLWHRFIIQGVPVWPWYLVKKFVSPLSSYIKAINIKRRNIHGNFIQIKYGIYAVNAMQWHSLNIIEINTDIGKLVGWTTRVNTILEYCYQLQYYNIVRYGFTLQLNRSMQFINPDSLEYSLINFPISKNIILYSYLNISSVKVFRF